ncbi:hypothetical protein HELRODRAFT_182656 [Helobdella robusta]|uniref:LicD/FKTN/FKRP nucleotidyltransferase domain-containing protein n=1 Tax=Helobdella robusta TaxID=6412 RepID=T1FIJ8_HELRO|nr:hypothetical protein HELRODRAFT_182656 [Helobdella robusta]ESN90248.1 hypothetical protein HELRODRAFT_182656 [Helobdella robusta]
MIGSFRHHGIIPWDDDVDVMLNWNDSSKLYKALSQYKNEEYSVYAGLVASLSSYIFKNTDNNIDFNMRFASKRFQWKYYSNKARKVLIWPYKYPYIDIFFYEDNSTHLKLSSQSFPEIYEKKLIFPLSSRPFESLSLPAPCNLPKLFDSRNIDIDTCVSSSFNHKIDLPMLKSPITVPCKTLDKSIPTVNRTLINRNNFLNRYDTNKETWISRKIRKLVIRNELEGSKELIVEVLIINDRPVNQHHNLHHQHLLFTIAKHQIVDCSPCSKLK